MKRQEAVAIKRYLKGGDRNENRKSKGNKNARIEYVSLVDKVANKKKFLITKSANDKVGFIMSGRILKADEETHHITGIV